MWRGLGRIFMLGCSGRWIEVVDVEVWLLVVALEMDL